MIQVSVEDRTGGPRVVVYAEGVELPILNAKILWDPDSRYVPDGRVRITIDCFAQLVGPVPEDKDTLN